MTAQGGGSVGRPGNRGAPPRAPWKTALVVAAIVGGAALAAAEDPAPRPAPRDEIARETRERTPSAGREPKTRREPRREGAEKPRSRPRPKPAPKPKPAPTRRPQTTPAVGTLALVTRVVDGDTIEVRLGGRVVDVRLIGIDTPETVHPSQPVECFGRAASAFTTSKLQGRTVRLEYDVERRDHYGRTLAYVWLDGNLFNQTLVGAGFASVSTYPPNVKYVDRFHAAQRRARRDARGLWAGCDEPAAPQTVSGGGDGGGAGGGNCDPNYAGACIPSYPPDLDCDDVPQGFRSTGSDPHGFDGDSDGYACE